MTYQEKFWQISKAQEEMNCANEGCPNKILPEQIYFTIEEDKKFLKICVTCFIKWCNERIGKLRENINEFNSIIGKCQMAEEEYGKYSATHAENSNK